MKCGELYLADFPFTDHSAAKLRPIVVASIAEFNRSRDFVALPISSVPDPRDRYSIYIADSHVDFASTGLKRSSAIKWTKPMTLAKTVVRRRLGLLWDELRREMLEKLRAMFDDS